MKFWRQWANSKTIQKKCNTARLLHVHMHFALFIMDFSTMADALFAKLLEILIMWMENLSKYAETVLISSSISLGDVKNINCANNFIDRTMKKTVISSELRHSFLSQSTPISRMQIALLHHMFQNTTRIQWTTLMKRRKTMKMTMTMIS